MRYADGLIFLVNDQFICELLHDAYKGKESDVCWSPVESNSNCPRLSSYCSLRVFDKGTREKLVGQLSKDRDIDLKDPESFMLYLKHDGSCSWEKSVNVVSLEFLDS